MSTTYQNQNDQPIDDGTRLSEATHLSHADFPAVSSFFPERQERETYQAQPHEGPQIPASPATDRSGAAQSRRTQAEDTVHRSPSSVGALARDAERQNEAPRRQGPAAPGIIPQASGHIRDFQRSFDLLVSNIGKVVVGKPTPIKLTVTALLAGGHILLEDNPGTGKTQLARAMAGSINAPFKRIQFTPDLLPSDVVGVTFYDQKSGKFDFRRGPVFASIVLADEINRASPKTQSALLEVMEEQKATVDGTTYQMPQPFIVIATQNPLEQLGTYKLPEAQMDRFLIKTSIGAPDRRTALEILKQVDVTDRAQTVSPVLNGSDIVRLRGTASEVHVDDRILEYIERLVEATRESEKLKAGSSMRGALALTRCARIWAAADGRDYVVPDDVKDLATPVLAHRLILSAESTFAGLNAERIVEELLETVPTPNIDA